MNRNMFIISILFMSLIMLVACSGQQETNTDNNKGESENSGSGGGNGVNVSIASHPQGSVYNSVATGVASILSKNGQNKAAVTPYEGPNAWIPLLNQGDVELGVASVPDVAWAFRGESTYDQNKNVRMLVRGNPMFTAGYTVREDSEIQSTSDLKGRKATSDYAGNQIVVNILEAQLRGVGLGWDDIVKVPVPSSVAGMEALQTGNADAVFAGSITSPTIMEVNNAIGVRVLNFADVTVEQVKNNDIPEKVMKPLTELVPGTTLAVRTEGILDGEETVVTQYPTMLASYSDISDDVAYDIVKTLFENYEELHPIHAALKLWVPEQMFDPNPAVPYHPGAIKYFKEIGVWTDEVQALQDELLKLAE
ncbi:TAXI family TRAP transporter solute-binding subunit [Bacillus sp. Marseille-P3661]|uniref:TAXI family TRAP transporter solute-binding subunit n=1 Tax=Bacillus sp. Marseille-P3661 TaxID=1936234 RepID=UPI0015E1AD44|nr:TAXI family TRAP transporter solute-binding subunit [Bacillus sp. Marseille-P3661]